MRNSQIPQEPTEAPYVPGEWSPARLATSTCPGCQTPIRPVQGSHVHRCACPSVEWRREPDGWSIRYTDETIFEGLALEIGELGRRLEKIEMALMGILEFPGNSGEISGKSHEVKGNSSEIRGNSEEEVQ